MVPADMAIGSGQTAKFRVRLLDAKGNFLREVAAPPPSAEEQPAAPQQAATAQRGQPPAARPPQDQRPAAAKDELQWSVEQLAGSIKADGSYTAPADSKPYAGKIKVRFGNLTGEARLRVIPSAWDTNFDDLAVGSAPAWWLSTAGRFAVKAVDGNNRVLAKVAGDSSPSMRQARAFLGLRTMTNY